MFKALGRSAAAALFAIGLAGNAQAAIGIDAAEVGGDLVFTFSGTLDLTGSTPGTTGSPDERAGVGSTVGALLSFPTGSLIDIYTAPSFPVFGATNSGATDGIASGDAFGVFSSNAVGVPAGYAGEFLQGSMTLLDVNFSTFGLIAGVYTSTLVSGDTITLTIPDGNANPVPGPAAALLFAPAILALRKKRKA